MTKKRRASESEPIASLLTSDPPEKVVLPPKIGVVAVRFRAPVSELTGEPGPIEALLFLKSCGVRMHTGLSHFTLPRTGPRGSTDYSWSALRRLIKELAAIRAQPHEFRSPEQALDWLIGRARDRCRATTLELDEEDAQTYPIIVAALEDACSSLIGNGGLRTTVDWGVILPNRVGEAAFSDSSDHFLEQGVRSYEIAPYALPFRATASTNQLLLREALARGVSTIKTSRDSFEISGGNRGVLHFAGRSTPLGAGGVTRVSMGRAESRRLLAAVGLPTRNPSDLASQSSLGNPVLVEVLVVGGDPVSAVETMQPTVRMDGRTKVWEAFLQASSIRKANPGPMAMPRRNSRSLTDLITNQGLTWASTPPADQRILLADSPDPRKGGTTTQILSSVDDSILAAAAQVGTTLALGPVYSTTFLLRDPSSALDSKNGGIVSVSSAPALVWSEFPMWGDPVNVASLVFDAVIQDRARSSLTQDPAPVLQRLTLRDGHDAKLHRRKSISVKVRFEGKVQKVGFRAWVARRAAAWGVSGWVTNHADGHVDALFSGEAGCVAALCHAAFVGPRKAEPTRAEFQETIYEGPDEFTII